MITNLNSFFKQLSWTGVDVQYNEKNILCFDKLVHLSFLKSLLFKKISKGKVWCSLDSMILKG